MHLHKGMLKIWVYLNTYGTLRNKLQTKVISAMQSRLSRFISFFFFKKVHAHIW